MNRALSILAAAASLGLMVGADAASLRPQAVVEADLIRLGDLFDGAGPRAEIAVAHAPAPGRRLTLDYAWLAELARIHQVAWRPSSRFDRVVVERPGRTVTAPDLVPTLRAALETQGAKGDSEIELSNRGLQIDLALEVPNVFEVRNATYDRASGRFSAIMVVGGSHAGAQRISLAGRVHDTVPVPVLRRSMNPGDVIAAADIEWSAIREDARRDMVLDPAKLIGMTPRQRLRAATPLRESEVRAPIVVERNAAVTIVLRTAAMTLTAQGRALEDGARGDVIRVSNLQSKKTIEAAVAGPDLVTVRLVDSRLAADATN